MALTDYTATDTTDEEAKRKALLGQMSASETGANTATQNTNQDTGVTGTTNSFLAGDNTSQLGKTTQGVTDTTQASAGAANTRGDANWLNFANEKAGNSGFDASKGQSGASAAADAARNGGLQAMVDEYNKKYGTTAKVVGNDKIDFGNGPQDVIRDSGNGTNAFWLASEGAQNNSQAGTSAGTTAAYSGAANLAGTSATSALTGTTATSATDISGTDTGLSETDKAARQAILNNLQKSQQQVTGNEANIAASQKVYSDTRNRQADMQRSKMAERAANSGLLSGGESSGSFDTGLNSVYQSAGSDIAGNQADLMNKEVDARRQDLKNAIDQANAVGNRDEANKLTKQLADMENAFKYKALEQTGALTREQIAAENSRQQKQLDAGQSQWNDQYGLSKSQQQYQRDRDAMLAAMGK